MATLVEKESVECANCNDLGMPVVEHKASSLRELHSRQTFYTCARVIIRKFQSHTDALGREANTREQDSSTFHRLLFVKSTNKFIWVLAKHLTFRDNDTTESGPR